MTVSGPKIRDFTDRQRSLAVSVESDTVYEVLLAAFVLGSDSDPDEYEVLGEVLAAMEERADERLRADIASMGEAGELGLTLLGVAHELPMPRTVEALVSRIREMDPAELRTLMMRNTGIKPSRGHDPATIERAAQGDIDAVRQLVAALPHACHLGDLLEFEPEEMRELIASVLERVAEVIAPVLAKWRDVIERDATNTAAMAKTVSPEVLVEQVTNGVTFEMQPQVSGVLLIPSVVIRPWVVIAEHYTLRIFAYSVSAETLAADSDAPPAFLVDTFKALGDEKRLRMLGALAERDMGLKELAERVDVAKSTAHHHVRILRSAGLVRVIVGDDDKRYSLRRDSVPEAGRLLETYLQSRPRSEEDGP